ncbi:hypothetical protein [Bacteroides caecimuris]|uniref:hypothetical protein n=1 Tax=Bacteroides caecimuris TaxID=1796613 RepID=UPI0025746038|nr:hypothetical protein [Bacteroides caecimuris]
MTILQQPDSLSLSGNIKEFRIGTTDLISFRLLQGDEEIVARSYEPGADGVVIINIQDIIHARLSFLFNNTSIVYEQKTIVSTFRALLSDTEVEFTAIRCGVDMLADTPANFLLQNFLTWQPNIKPVTYYSPEFLTYYAVQECKVKLHAYFTNESATVVSQSDLILADLTKGKAYTIPLQYASVVGKLGDKMPAYYDVWVEDAEGIRLSYVQRYYASDMKSETEQWVLFENSLGGIDTFRAYGSTAFTGEHTHNIAEIDDISLEYRVDTARKFQKDTGYLNKKERTWLLDFFPSLKKYLYTGAYIRSIIVVESNVTYTDKELPSNYTFTYKFADAKPFLNLQRSDTPTDALEIVVPEVGSFTVPPRLIEFPRLPLSEGALFPVQDPFSENWNVTTAGSLGDFIAERIAKDYGGGGGVGHQHNNIDLLQLMSYAAEYLLVSGKKIKAGYADKAGWIDGLEDIFLHKNKHDQSNALLEFLAGANVGEAIDDLVLGKGTILTPDGRIQTNNLQLRDSLTVLELIFNRLYAMESDYSFSESNTIESLELLNDGTYCLTLRKRWENDFTAFRENDIVYGWVNNLASETGEYYASWLRVLYVDTSANIVNAVLYPDNEVPGGKNYPPEPLMVITRRGNPVNEERQSYWYLSSREHCICMLDGVTKPILEESNYSVIVGRLKHLTIFDNLPINYRQSYIYCRGITAQDYFEIDYKGNVARQENNRGLWSASEAVDNPYQSDDKMYDAVYHYGCKWMCLQTGATDEPRYGSVAWAMIEGNPEFTIDIESSNGWYFDVDRFATTLTVIGELYNRDVTSHILDDDIEWTRDTGNVTEDNAWAVAHAGVGKSLPLTVNDLGPDYMLMTGCKFIAKALLRDGQGNYETVNYVTF